MGKLAIRRIAYIGKKYSYTSPYLNDGIVILEGTNGHGKSTFMNLIYYGLGGKVDAFNKSDKEVKKKHNEIYHDEDNYVELEIEIGNQVYELTRYIGNNQIFIVDKDQNIIETYINRQSANEDDLVFSDWILDKLDIRVFDIIQGTRSFKLNFSDLMRLIYHDQDTEVDRIYKEADNVNFMTDSLEIRRAIFEVLVGKTYDEYYSSLGEYKIKLKEYEKIQAIMRSYDEFLGEVLEEELSNAIHINLLLTEYREMLIKVKREREIAINEKSNSNEIMKLIEEQKRLLVRYQHEQNSWYQAKVAINNSIEKILYLIDDSEKEMHEVEKILVVNKKLKLFSPNTCPYCLREVEREEGQCICGTCIEEEQYEKFFYTDQEYIDILKIKKRSLRSLNDLLEKKNLRMKQTILQTEYIESEIAKVTSYINELTQNIESEYNSAYIRKLDEREREISGKIIELEQAEELAKKRENIITDFNRLRNEVGNLKNRVDSNLILAKEDIFNRRNDFSEIYMELMKLADEYCFSAYLGEDYMPEINFRLYRERSASVPRRLMYFLTLLIESLKEDVNFPRFLMIDTPNKEGIDKENLINNISLLSKADDYAKENNLTYQIILTTGMNTYPDSLKDKVFLSLDGGRRLLRENTKLKEE